MKILSKEEEDAHYRAVIKGGALGTVVGLIGGVAGVMAASKRYHTIRNLTLPMKAFLTTSSATFVGIIAADHASRRFEMSRNAEMMWYQNREQQLHQQEIAQMSATDRLINWARREKYKIVGATWIASMIGSFVLVGRNPYLSGQQKIVQARVYAQGLTLAVLVASAAFEISDQRKGRGILDAAKKSKEAARQAKEAELQPLRSERDDQSDLWKDMVAAEEARLKQKHQSLYEHDYNNQKENQESQKNQQQQQQGEDSDDEKKKHLKLEQDLNYQKAQRAAEKAKNEKLGK